jgi:hypothetical protein
MEISREHYFSEGVLRALGLDEGQFSGLIFQDPGQTSNPGVDAVRAKVLCTRHNQAMSPLDSQAIRFATALAAVVSLGHPATPDPSEDRFWLLNGHDIERWISKALAGAMAAGVLRIGVEPVGKLAVPERLLDLIAGDEVLEPPAGLYFIQSPPTLAKSDFGFKVKWGQRREILGVELRIHSVDMLLWLGENKPPYPEGALVYRGAGKYAWRGSRFAAMELHWEGDGGPLTQIAHRPSTGMPLPNYPTNDRWGHWGRPPV